MFIKFSKYKDKFYSFNHKCSEKNQSLFDAINMSKRALMHYVVSS